MSPSSADRNLLYGILALRLGFIGRDALLAAMGAWVAAKDKPIGQILIERGWLDPADQPAIELAVSRHLERDGDAGRSLASLEFAVADPVPGLLQSLDDAELRASLSRLDARGGGASRWDETTALGPEGTGEARRAGAPGWPAAPGGRARFRIIRPHAKGGLGEVFLAWDEEFGRHVALKVMKAEPARSDSLRARFVREAEVNANLEHPGIVPVYGQGTDRDGRPFYAMRFVLGETLQAAIDRFHAEAAEADPDAWALRLRHLVGRFLVVCRAIEYAHSRKVVHRDLKPANLLLGKYGETLIIDWGLAKLVGAAEEAPAGDGPPEDEEPISLAPSHASRVSTMAGQTLGSPPYMSPEQAMGRHAEIGPPSDIYSLGATFYCVLTGRPPATGRKTSEILEKVVRGEIAPAASANPRVPRALEAICARAMALKPAARYGSAQALADDLERWLADQPVSVYRDPVGTRLLRWARHHKGRVGAAAATAATLFVALVVANALIGVQKRQAERERNRAVLARRDAEKARDEAEAARRRAREHLQIGLGVLDQLVSLGDRQLVAQQSPAARQQFLKATVPFLRRFRETDPDSLLVRSQAAQVALRLAHLYHLMGRFAEADPLYDEARHALRELVPGPRGVSPYGDLLAETQLEQGESLLTRGRAKEAEAILIEAEGQARRLVAAFPRNAGYPRTLGRSLWRLAAARLARGRSDAAAAAREAIDRLRPLADAALPSLAERVQAEDVLALNDQTELAQAQATLAEALRRSGAPAEAKSLLRSALGRMDRISRDLRGKEVIDAAWYHAWVATRLARLLMERGAAPDAARGLLDDAATRLGPLASGEVPLPPVSLVLADALAARARLRERAGAADEARSDAEAARSRIAGLPDAFRATPEPLSVSAEAAAVLGRLARGPEARARFEEAVRDQGRALASSPEDPTLRDRLSDYRALLARAPSR